MGSLKVERGGVPNLVSFSRGVAEALTGNSDPLKMNGTLHFDLDPEVREHEPRIALDGGPDGLDVLRRAVRAAPAHMAGGAWLLLEIGFGQAEAVTELVEKAGLEPGRVLSDPANIERVVQGRKPE